MPPHVGQWSGAEERVERTPHIYERENGKISGGRAGLTGGGLGGAGGGVTVRGRKDVRPYSGNGPGRRFAAGRCRAGRGWGVIKTANRF
ncbi:MAG: hypothetical protein ABSA18_09965 [Dehalococcoidia bacterium]